MAGLDIDFHGAGRAEIADSGSAPHQLALWWACGANKLGMDTSIEYFRESAFQSG